MSGLLFHLPNDTAQPALPQSLTGIRVLIADDDDFMLDCLEEVLDQLGVKQIQRVRDGNELLVCVDDPGKCPDLIFCDLDMDGMDGIECLRHLAERKFRGAMFAVSGASPRLLGSMADLARAHHIEFLGAIAKPIDSESIRAAIMAFGARSPQKSQPSVERRAAAPLTPDEILQGIAAGHVDVFFQPKVTIADRKVVGAEALLRWRDPVRGMMAPQAVVQVAEAHGIVNELTRAVYRKSIIHLAEWWRCGHCITMAINLSMEDLVVLNLPDLLLEMTRSAGTDPTHVLLEITETRLMVNFASSLEVIGRLRLKGFRLSIDDFGTGYANHEKLVRMPFDEIKIDRAFVHNATNDASARAVLESSVDLGHILGMQVVGEGTETLDDWNLLAAIGCDISQGYYLARPMPADQFIDWKIQWEAKPGTRE
jgi:EAL domain-containing protein (putative c-di-GMP-specific phosphodiesterase class I)/AmiR/NasT family two-component response regulator